jgi:hypothetical protein
MHKQEMHQYKMFLKLFLILMGVIVLFIPSTNSTSVAMSDNQNKVRTLTKPYVKLASEVLQTTSNGTGNASCTCNESAFVWTSGTNPLTDRVQTLEAEIVSLDQRLRNLEGGDVGVLP